MYFYLVDEFDYSVKFLQQINKVFIKKDFIILIITYIYGIFQQ